MVIWGYIGSSWPWSDHGQTGWSFMVIDGHLFPLTMVDHGQNQMVICGRWWSFEVSSTMVDHGLTMVKKCGHWMVNHGQSIICDHGRPWCDHCHAVRDDHHWPYVTMTIWPWSTMVMTIVPFYKRGRPWSNHVQMMVTGWSTIAIWQWSTMVWQWLTMVWPWTLRKGNVVSF